MSGNYVSFPYHFGCFGHQTANVFAIAQLLMNLTSWPVNDSIWSSSIWRELTNLCSFLTTLAMWCMHVHMHSTWIHIWMLINIYKSIHAHRHMLQQHKGKKQVYKQKLIRKVRKVPDCNSIPARLYEQNSAGWQNLRQRLVATVYCCCEHLVPNKPLLGDCRG